VRIRALQTHGGTGLCGKKWRVRKGVPQHDRITTLSEDGIIILEARSRLGMNAGWLHWFVTLPPDQADYISPQRSFGLFCAIWSCNQPKAFKTTLDRPEELR
jgi:hypothetical protein